MKDLLTERQLEIYELWRQHGTNNKVAEVLGVNRRTVDRAMVRIRSTLEAAGYSELSVNKYVGPGYKIKGKSTLVDENGNAKLQWVKTEQDKEQQLKLMQEVVESFKEDIKPQKPVKMLNMERREDLLNAYIITDYHLGMLAWGEETKDDDWDLEIAEKTLLSWFESAIALSPNASHAVFCQLGDFLHWDGFDAVTPTSGHLLDADTRFQKLVRSAIKVIRKVIQMLLVKHEHVTVIMAEGNHDMSSSIWLRELFAALYGNEKRISIDISPDPYYCVEWGDTALFFHHGHKSRPENIAQVFAAKFREIWGRVKHAYAHTGHMHHKFVKETVLMIIEQHNTLAAKDAHSSRGGYDSERLAQVITYHQDYGEVSRLSINYDMVKQ